MSGWACACGGDLAGGLQVMEAELSRVSVMGPHPTYYAGLMAGIRLEDGKAAQALELVDTILKTAREPGVGFFLSELYRLRGECLLQLDSSTFDEAVRDFETAIATANRQHARTFALRAAISLARAWSAKGAPEKGSGPLREVVSAFGADDGPLELSTARQILSDL